MRILAFLFLLSSLYPSEIKLSTTQSVFHTIENSDIYFHLQYSQLSMTDNFSYGTQWWPSNNLYLTGLFSNLTLDNDRTLYHHIALGYSNSDWKFSRFTSNAIEIGVHRLRFYKDSIYRWFHAGFKTRTTFKKINYGFNFTRFFYNTWTANRYTFNVEKTVKGVIINGGILHDEFNPFTPFVGVSLGL